MAKKIYVLDEEKQLQEIDSGATSYNELTDLPIQRQTLNTMVSVVDDKMVLTPSEGYEWTEEDVLLFARYAETGRYDILTANNGTEILMVDKTNAAFDTGDTSDLSYLNGRARRITVDFDEIYDNNAKGWVMISDTSARALVFSVSNISEIPATTVVGNRVVMECYYYSTVGNGTITVTKVDADGNLVRTVAVLNLSVGSTTSIVLTSDIEDGLNNFRYIVTNNGTGSLEKQQVANFSITGIELNYVPTFSVNRIRRGDIIFPIVFRGTGTKYAHFDITNGRGEVSSFEPGTKLVNDDSTTITIPAQYFSHGENKISTYIYMKDGNTEDILTRTDDLIYKFPYFEVEDEPIIMTYFDFNILKEWDTVSIPYRIWANDAASSIKFELKYIQYDAINETYSTKFMTQEYTNEKEAYITNYLAPTLEHQWQLSNIPHGSLTFNIYINGEETPRYTMTGVEIAESEYNFRTIDNYLFNFAPTDITDTKSFETWVSNDATLYLDGFNWTTDGIVTEADKSLRFAPSASVIMPYGRSLFNYAAGSEGMSLEFDFKVDDTAANDEVVIKYVEEGSDNNYGIFIYPTKAVFNYDTTSAAEETLVVYYQKGERVNLSVSIDPFDTEATQRFLKVYLNGILSKVIHYSVATKFPTACNMFEFNCSGTQLDLYGFRAYNRTLTAGNMLQNYISNFASTDTKISMLTANNIFSNDTLTWGNGIELNGEYVASFNKIKGKIGCLVVITDSLPVTKDYVKCSTIWYEKDENNPEVEVKKGKSMATTYTPGTPNNAIKFGAQGTSSLEYPRKNFKFKFGKKFYIKGHTDGPDKTYTMKADYMDSSGANNICNAQITQNGIIPSDWPNTPVAAGKRLNLDGFPCCIFHARYVDGDGIPYNLAADGLTHIEPEYLGTFNFNYDKKAKALLGWENEGYDFQGFEFRDNTSDICLEKGISNFVSFESENIGFEWRWSPLTDLIDDYHDGNLSLTMDGGYFDEDVTKYTEKQYVQTRIDKEISILKPFNRFYIGDDQVFVKEGEEFNPFNYSYLPHNLNVFALEYGVKIANSGLYWQDPYGVTYLDNGEFASMGSRYPSGEGYYKYSRNPEHNFYYEYNDTEDYFNNIENWTLFSELEGKIYKKHIEHILNENGTHVLDSDGEYHPLEYYIRFNDAGDEDPAGEFIQFADEDLYNVNDLDRFMETVEFIQVVDGEKIETVDLMKEIFGHWWYAVDTIAHSTDANFTALIDSNRSYSDELGDNGRGLFIYSALLDYYVLSVICGLCDNFSKNMFVHSYDGGRTWVSAWYDMDTCFGLNNTGAYVFDYDVDFKDPGVFNGSNSTLWDKMYRLNMADLQAKYREIRKSKISYEQIMKVVYDANIKYKSEAMYNANAFFRYIIPDLNVMSGTQLSAAQGSRLPLLKYWNYNREIFLDSRYGGDDYSSDIITMRMSAPKTFTFELTPDTNMFLGFAFNQADSSMPATRSGKILANTTWKYTYNLQAPLQDLNTYIFGASHLVDVGDLSPCVPKNINLSVATKIKKLILGTDDPVLLARHDEVSSIQGVIVTMPTDVCRNLKVMDFHNLKYLDFGGGNTALTLINKQGSVITNLYPALETLDIRGTNINTVVIGDYTPLIYIGLPALITNVTFNNLIELQKVDIDDVNKVNSITMVNCPKLNQLELLKRFVNLNTSVVADNIHCGVTESVTSDFMDWLMRQDATLAGSIYVQNIADSNLDKYRAFWPDLEINLDQIYAKEVIFAVSGEGNEE